MDNGFSLVKIDCTVDSALPFRCNHLSSYDNHIHIQHLMGPCIWYITILLVQVRSYFYLFIYLFILYFYNTQNTQSTKHYLQMFVTTRKHSTSRTSEVLMVRKEEEGETRFTQMFVNLDVRIGILISNTRKRRKRKV